MWRKHIPWRRNIKGKGPEVWVTSGMVKEEESKPMWCAARGEVGITYQVTQGCSLGKEQRVFLSTMETAWRILSRGMTWHDTIYPLALGCYMENELRIWKLIPKRHCCNEEQRFLPSSFHLFFFSVLLFPTLNFCGYFRMGEETHESSSLSSAKSLH